jgi:GAF domain-containing protein
LITLVGEDAQLFLGSHGLPDWAKQANGTPVEWSFCATTVRTGEPYVVNDARAHVVHRSNPLVTSQGIASYAGAPLVTSSGHVLGACCVLDTKPREFTELDVAELSSAAASLVHSFEIPNDAAA